MQLHVLRAALPLLLAGLGLLGALPANAFEVQPGRINRLENPNAYQTIEPYCCGLPMIQPGNKALIDDYWINGSVSALSYPVAGDYMGTRATSPSGSVQTNYVTWDGRCWTAPYITSCSVFASWYLGTRIQFTPGAWKIEWIGNGVSFKTEDFQVVPYDLAKYSGDGQAIAVKSTTPLPLVVRLLKGDGLPAIDRPIAFTVTSRPGGAKPAGGLSRSASYSGSTASSATSRTDGNGLATIYLDTGGKEGTYAVSATSAQLAPAQTISFTVQATGTSPLDSAQAEKNLGGDPGNNSSCPNATAAHTDNPINIATGNKLVEEVDYEAAGVWPLRMQRYYNSLGSRAGSFGASWRGFYDRRLVVTSTTAKGKTTTTAEAVRPDGRVLRFKLSGGVWVADPDVVDRLESIAGGYRYTCGNDQVETYNAAGRLGSLAAREGFAQTLSYDSQGRLVEVTDAFGRSLNLQYDSSDRVAQLADPAGKLYVYAYSAAGQLVSVRYPDHTLRQYLYENPAWPRALTGIVDENGSRFATYDYDTMGRAVRSVHAGGTMQRNVHFYSNGTRDVVDALGSIRRYGFTVIQGVNRRTSMDNAACASCGNAVTATGYNASGYVSSVTDYRGTQTSFVRDARGLETSRTEAVGQPEARSITTTWHSVYRVPLTVTRSGQRTSFTYDGAGRMTSRSLTDTVTGAVRAWTYTYNPQGLLASVDGPRTDVADVTLYGYDAQGNLTSVRNALGHVTRFTSHDAHGRVSSMSDPNGLVTTYSYDLRGRLTGSNVGGQATTYSYDAVGQLIRVTRADGTWIENQYDAAHRLVGWVDSGGHRMAYTLDAEGRRVRQEHFDASNNSTFLRRFTHDPLGRVLKEIDSLDRVQRRYAYDSNGNRVSDIDAFGAATTSAYDGLNRLSRQTDPLGAQTTYVHDARDNLTRVTDPVGAVTTYSHDGLDNRVAEASPDAGTSTFGFDAAGNLRSRNWPNGRAVTVHHDALDRPVTEDYGPGVQVAHQYDSGANGIGRRTSVSDPAGNTTWSHDLWGRVLEKNRQIGTRVLATAYSYDDAGRLASLTYPSGRVLGHAYDAGGRVASLTLDGAALISGIDWVPFGAPRSWTQGNGRWVNRTVDRDGQLLAHDFDAGLRSLAYDEKGRITQVAESIGYSNYNYDAADRLTGQNTAGQTWVYSYDGNGNRLTQSTPAGNTSYLYAAASNRLQSAAGMEARGFAHDAAGNLVADGAAAYVYDERNRLMQAPGAGYAYDGQGLRVYKASAATGARYYAHDLERKVLGEYGPSGAVYEAVWLGTMPIAVIKDGQRHWVDADQVDAPRIVRNDSDQIVWRWYSEAFGHSSADENPSGLGAFEFNLRFPGQVFDRETGLHYNDQRDYSPKVGRYIQADPIGLAGGINIYTYVAGNPVSFVDPAGLDVTVCLYPGAATAGHVGIGVNSSSTVGLYPRSDSPGMGLITGTPGAIKADVRQSEQCKTVSTSAEQDRQMSEFIALATATPGTYRLTGNNCTHFVRSVLQRANISTPSFPGPRPYFDALPSGR